MEIWLDTADLALIEKADQMGILHGVTTNPTIVAKSAMSLEDLLARILNLQKGPVTVQVMANDYRKMVEQGEALFGYANRIVVKIPATAEGLRAIYALSQKKIPTMATAVFDQNQVLLAARAGASYIAPYYSGICESDMNGIESLKGMLRLLHRYNFASKLLAASLRSTEQVKDCAEMGAHAATVNERVFADLIEDHPLTLESVKRFAKDWTKAKPRRILLL